MVNLTIDGKNVQVPEGTTVLHAAEAAGIRIPTLCDHPALKPLGGCRLCLVEVDGYRNLQTSCTLPVAENMVVRTNTSKVNDARTFVLSMIFSERNHFCPYCQVSGGDCDLQNSALEQGMTHWPLVPNWQAFAVDASHPYYVMDHNRCILCQRCIRACGELVGNFTLGLEERGTRNMVVADYGVPLGESSCVSCGTCTQVCPTGALISRRSAYQGHENQADAVNTVCINCSVGCATRVLVRDNRVIRIDGDWDGVVNGGVLCKEGRFLPMEEDRDRITSPLVRRNGKLEPASWDEAVAEVIRRFKPLAGKKDSGVAALASTRLPVEALSLFKQVFAEGLGSNMVAAIDEGKPTALPAKLAEELGGPFEGRLSELDQTDCVVNIGTNLVDDHQVAGFMLKRILPGDKANLIVVNSQETGIEFFATAKFIVPAEKNLAVLKGLQAALAKVGANSPAGADAALEKAAAESGVPATEFLKAVAVLGTARHPVFIYGKELVAGASLETLKELLALARLVGAHGAGYNGLINVKGKANSQAAAQYGLDVEFALDGRQAAFVALGDDRPSDGLVKRFEKAPFLAVQASYKSALTERADVVLPVENWAELEGHFLNLEGRLQKANRVLQPAPQVRSNAAALTALAEGLGFKTDTAWKERLLRRVSAVTISEN